MLTRYEFPDTPSGGGSGVHSGEFETRIGRIRFIHWVVKEGKKTSIELWLSDSGLSNFEVHYPGHDDIDETNAWMKFLGKMIDIAGPIFVLDLVEKAAELHYEIGAAGARAEIRKALGLL
jgi:hypothetical protein